MKQNLRIALAQINSTVGDLEGNALKICAYISKASKVRADMVVFPELALCGYPPEDLLLKPKFIDDNLKRIDEIKKYAKDIVVILGFVDRSGGQIYNAASVICRQKVQARYHKIILPNYGVFDQKRYFSAGQEAKVFKLGKCVFGVNICEDIWSGNGPAKLQARLGAKLIISINASPYSMGKLRERQLMLSKRSKAEKLSIAYLNSVGGQDELVFDGQSMIVDNQGNTIARAEAFKEDLLVADISLPNTSLKSQKKIKTIPQSASQRFKPAISSPKRSSLKATAETYQALLLGLGDYVRKNSFEKVVIGLSGGIDSCLVAVLAADALGAKNVIGAFMPSRFSSAESERDARELAESLKIKLINIPIEEIYKSYLKVLKMHFSEGEEDITEENLQARIRGNLLMALSNKFGWLVLATGNKSEMSTGYATLYGDMAGGFAAIKDVPKTLVYKLAKYRNSIQPAVIPENAIARDPTAELREGQLDRDTLPDYATLDPILEAYIENNKDFAKISAMGFEKDTIQRVLKMVDRSEYKRRQSPPGIKITYRANGRDRRMPITNKYK